MLLIRDMGCGRSKNQSPNSSAADDLDKQTKKKKQKIMGDQKENKDPQKTTEKQTNESVSKPVTPPGAVEAKGPLLEVNGTVHVSEDAEMDIPLDKAYKKSKSAFRDKTVTGNPQNLKVTNSQIEFFKMLDEKIEKGKEYMSEESFDSL